MPSDSTDVPLDYYARQGIMTDPLENADLLKELPADIPTLCQVVQGIMIHIFWARRSYGLELSDERKREVQIRKVAQKLTSVVELDGRPLTAFRSPEKRLVGNCRDFSVMLCAILRNKGIAARARCGFGTYFTPGRFEDHWVCEYWKADERRWVMVDTQLDDNQRKVLQIRFDPFDVSGDRFLVAGKAWHMCRSDNANPDDFGIFNMHGMWFIRGNVVRDFLSLNKIELLPWDSWGIIEKKERDLTAEDIALIDRLASLSLAGNESFHEIRMIYERDNRLHMPSGWKP